MLFALALFQTAWADMPSQPVNPKGFVKDFPVVLLFDSSKELSLPQVIEQSSYAKKTTSRVIHNQSGHYWYGFELTNPTDQKLDLVLGLDEVYLHQVDLYTWQDSSWRHQRNGLVVPLDERPAQSQLPVFTLQLEPGESKQFFLMVGTDLSEVMSGLFVAERSAFIQQQRLELVLFSIVIGILLALVGYNLFLFLSLRDLGYSFYVAHVAMFLLYFLSYTGYSLFFNINDSVYFALGGIAGSCTGFLVLFSRHILRTERLSPKLDRFLIYLAMFFFVLAVVSAFDIQFYYLAILLTIPTMLILFFVGVYAVYLKQKIAKIYLMSLSLYLFGMFYQASMSSGFMEYVEPLKHVFVFGAVMEVLIFSLALAYRIKILQEEKESVQQELIAQQVSETARLEFLVEQRTLELQKVNQELEWLSHHDSLTGLFNRRYFDQAFESAWQEMQKVKGEISLILCDVDYFKLYNDKLGHKAGDHCLKVIAEKLHDALRDKSLMVSRYGGEEFAIILTETDSEAACQLAELLRLAVMELKISHPKSVFKFVTMSYGVCTAQVTDKTESELLFIEADNALYVSKSLGRNRVTSHIF
jgi:diguanylate cyclase (GGDEF)-like protein